MAWTPAEGTTTAPVLQDTRAFPFPQLALGYVFHPDGRYLLKHYLFARALGRVAPEDSRGFILDSVDVYAVRPEALPFPRCNTSEYGEVWGYFVTTRPVAAAGGTGVVGGSNEDDDDDARNVAAGGCWRRYGADKEYVGDYGEVYGFRRRFAFHEAGAHGKKTAWRMKEFSLNEAALALRGVVSHPSARGLVVWKVYYDVVPEEEPAVDYYDIDDDDHDEEIGAVVITVGDEVAAPTLHDGMQLCITP